MRTWLLVGSVAAGLLLFVYEWYSSREQEQRSGHSGGNGGGRPRTYPAEDFIDLTDETAPRAIESHLRGRRPPGPDENCSICLDPLISRQTEGRKYCIIALPKCGHWFHQRCAIRLLEYHPQCPVCRVNIDSSMLRGTPVRVIESSDEVSIVSGDANGPSTSRNCA